MKNKEKIIELTRGRGNSTWILKAAIKNPEVIIITKNKADSIDMENRFNELLEEEFKKDPWYIKLWYKFFKRKIKKPIFNTLHDLDRNRVHRFPVIFDNYSILD